MIGLILIFIFISLNHLYLERTSKVQLYPDKTPLIYSYTENKSLNTLYRSSILYSYSDKYTKYRNQFTYPNTHSDEISFDLFEYINIHLILEPNININLIFVKYILQLINTNFMVDLYSNIQFPYVTSKLHEYIYLKQYQPIDNFPTQYL